MRSLNRKLLRDLWHLRGQMASIAIVVATGIMTVVTMRGGYTSLVDARDDYYQQARFADVWSSLRRAPSSLADEIEAIPGVRASDTRISFLSTLDLPGLEIPGMGLFVSLPERGRPTVNDIVITGGRYLSGEADDEVIVSENFANARGLAPGDTVRAILNGTAWDLSIVGTAISPEHAYAVPPGALYPEDERYGVFWMSERSLAPAFDMDGAFNNVALTITNEVSPASVVDRLDGLLAPYGGLGAYLRAEQPSHLILEGELDQNRVMGAVIPGVFLAVAAFLLNLVLARLIATQRTEIAVLKAFGYRNAEVGWHYLMYAVAAVAVGTVIGVLGGVWLGGAYIDLYAEYFTFPALEYRLSLPLVLGAWAVSAGAAVAGALLAGRRAASLPPAEAMRPAPPPSFRPGPLERLGVGRLLPSAGRTILRNMERTPVRVLLSSIGVATSVGILVIGMFMFDGIQWMIRLQFETIQREDLTLTFDEGLDASVRHELASMPGVRRVELFRTVQARLRSGHRERVVGIQGLDPAGSLRRVFDASGREVPIPLDGLLLSRFLADQLDLRPGDAVQVEMLEGDRRTITSRIAGTVEDLLGVSATMDATSLGTMVGGTPLASGAFILVDRGNSTELTSLLAETPRVASVSSPATALQSFETQLAEGIVIGVGFILGFASIISMAIIYNGARIALSERGREMASLRVMGFHRNEIATLLLGEQAIITLAAIPLGWIMGYALASSIATSLESEVFRVPVMISPRTYVLSALITIAASFLSSLVVRLRIDRLDLISVLKTRE